MLKNYHEMTKNSIRLLFTVFALMPLCFSCKDFIGAQVESNSNDRNIQIYGTVSNMFNNQPIYEALVKYADLQTLTDPKGNYSLIYTLNTDDDRNKPVKFNVSAFNYFPYSTELIVYPVDNNINISLAYAAPIVENSILVLHKFEEYIDELYVCQARILDYQGIDEIDFVNAVFYYDNQVASRIDKLILPMDYIENVSNNTAHYQALILPSFGDENWQIRLNFDIEVYDTLGFSTYIEDQVSSVVIGDTLIFTPVFLPLKQDALAGNPVFFMF